MTDQIPESAGIYAIVHTASGARYVGQATNVRARVQHHLRELRKGTHRTSSAQLLQAAWNEHGPDAFEVVVLELIPDNKSATNYHTRPDNLSLAEHYYINDRSEYNADKRIVRSEFQGLIDTYAWRLP